MPGNDLIIDTDVLVIGGGLAGCWAAIRARDFAPSVTLMEKAVVARSGASVFTNSMLAPVGDEEMEERLAEVVESGEWLSDQDWVKVLLEEQRLRIADLVSWGAPFERTAEGGLATTPGRGHRKTRLVMLNGHRLMEVMRRKVEEKGVKVLSRTMGLDLLTSDGKHPTGGSVIGAVGVNTVSGQFIVCRAKAVVVATGILDCKLRADYVHNCTGDGPAMGLRAGAQLLGMEFCTSSRLVAYNDRYRFGGSSLLQGLGARFINRLGEEFIGVYDPELKNRSKVSWICMAIAKECFEGRGPVYLDMTSYTPEKVVLAVKLLPSQMRSFQRLGLDVMREPIKIDPVVTISSSSGQGGVRIDTSCRSTIPGLWGAGSAAKNLIHGTYAIGGINLAYCNTSGYRAGENAGRAAMETKPAETDKAQVAALKKEALRSAGKPGWLPDEVMHRMHRDILTAGVCLFKNVPRLKAAVKEVRELARAPLTSDEPHEVVKANEVKNILALSEISLEASLLRQESRDSHYREDFPYRDDQNWLKWIAAEATPGGRTRIEAIPVPYEKYRVKPKERRRVPYPIQYTLKQNT
ncbi:MAG: FAD-binding protein [Chloroflexi bacterium]|nr:FAD-binding protein [Chloroflexota bacterium]